MIKTLSIMFVLLCALSVYSLQAFDKDFSYKSRSESLAPVKKPINKVSKEITKEVLKIEIVQNDLISVNQSSVKYHPDNEEISKDSQPITRSPAYLNE